MLLKGKCCSRVNVAQCQCCSRVLLGLSLLRAALWCVPARFRWCRHSDAKLGKFNRVSTHETVNFQSVFITCKPLDNTLNYTVNKNLM